MTINNRLERDHLSAINELLNAYSICPADIFKKQLHSTVSLLQWFCSKKYINADAIAHLCTVDGKSLNLSKSNTDGFGQSWGLDLNSNVGDYKFFREPHYILTCDAQKTSSIEKASASCGHLQNHRDFLKNSTTYQIMKLDKKVRQLKNPSRGCSIM